MTAETAAIQGISASGITAQWIVLPSVVRTYTDPTLMRTRGQVIANTGTSAGVVRGAFGIIAWDDIDDTVPTATNVPSPYSNPDLDWIWWSFFATANALLPLQYQASLGASGSDIDSKAMRRLGNRRGVLFVGELTAGSSSIGFEFGIRCLLKE